MLKGKDFVGHLDGKVAWVTGAGRGIGRAVAIRLAQEGARVGIVSRTQHALDQTARTIQEAGGTVMSRCVDVSVEEEVNAFASELVRQFGRIDALVNNASILTPKTPIHEVMLHDWERTMAVNLRGPFLCMKAVIPQMIRQGSGSIINISSGAGKRPAPLWGPYAVSKFGIEGLSRSAAEELSPYGIRVNAVNPGGTRTKMRAMAYPEEDPMTLPAPEEITGLFVYLASDASKGVTGQSIDVHLWLHEHPGWEEAKER